MNIGVIVSNSIAFLAFVTAVVVGIRSTRRDDASERRAEAAEQRAVAADERQQSIVDAQHQTNTRQHENNLLLAKILTKITSAEESVAEVGETRQMEVEWAVENTRKNTWLLRNLGAGVATSVLLDREALGGIRVDITPELPASIGAGESLTIRAFGAWGRPVAKEVRVTWGEDREQVIPLPRWF
ncbi:MAG: hypothetical protein ACRD3Q_05295 [Terriglobales bacterium]